MANSLLSRQTRSTQVFMPPSKLVPIRNRALHLSIRTSISQTANLSTSQPLCSPAVPQAKEAAISPDIRHGGTKSPAVRSTRQNRAKDTFSRTWRPSGLNLQYLADPVKLALSTSKLIRNGERDKALELARAASKDRPCTVSWNHIINDSMQQGKVQDGFHLFNEMRKRGQKPDGHTYTMLFRGLTQNVSKTPSAVQRAMALLNAMQSPDAPVEPSSIHINAAVEVCAKARDLDSVYAIVARLPEKGPGSPDHRTYTMILNCLTAVATQKPDLSTYREADVVRIRQQSILQGKRLWADVIHKWYKGKLTMDEGLLDAMGRLLLLGDVRNHDEILSLVAQTTQLPREVPMIGDPNRQTHLLTADLSSEAQLLTDGESAAVDGESAPAEAQPEAGLSVPDNSTEVVDPDLESQKLFAEVSSPQRLWTFARPRNRTLSLLMTACGRINALAAAQKYWGTITAEIEPDIHNYHEYMRVLRRQRASRLTVELVRQLCTPKDQDGLEMSPTPMTFRLAMSVCSRDTNNPQCLRHAREILALQREHIKTADPRTGQFLVDMMGLRMGQWPVEEVTATMDSLEAMWVNLKSMTAYGAGERKALAQEVTFQTRGEMARLTMDYYRLIEKAMAQYRERIDTETFMTWNQRLYRNRNKIVNWKKSKHEEWWFKGLADNGIEDSAASAQALSAPPVRPAEKIRPSASKSVSQDDAFPDINA